MTTLTRYAVQCRSEVSGRTLTGHAAVFGQVAEVGGGYEMIAPGAFDEVLSRSDTDVVAVVNHDLSLLLGRQSSGTLRLRSDSEGLAFDVDLPNTSYADDLRELVARGDLTGASFGFVPDMDKSTWTRTKDGALVHTINAVEYLRDVSPVTTPAYAGAGVALRSFTLDLAESDRSRLIRARARVHLKGART